MAYRLKCKHLVKRVRGPESEVVPIWRYENEKRYPSYGEALCVFEVCLHCGKRKRIKFSPERG